MTPKEQLYFLLKGYYAGEYSTESFCDQFPLIYNREINYEELSEKELVLFRELSRISSRYSSSEEDLKLPNVYNSEAKVKEVAQKVFHELITL